MKVVQINAVCGSGSTGKICIGISKVLNDNAVKNKIFYFSGKSDYPYSEKLTCDLYIKLQALKSRIFANYGFNSKTATKKLIKKLEEFNPDVIHLHNIHGHDLNLRIFFDYVKKSGKKVVWTFHDCWAFTGYCSHFTAVNCDKWQTGCNKCPQKGKFSWFFDKSEKNFTDKKNCFANVDLTVVTPSKWLCDIVKKSFLSFDSVKIINNGINLSVFKPIKSNVNEIYGISRDKFVLLGVAMGWDDRKGLNAFVSLAEKLPKDKFQIVLVGTDKKTEKKLPENVISIRRTKNQSELAELYSAADLFVNPTIEDTFPTVNIESLACGTPVVTYRTGGSPEIIDETCGSIVESGDIKALIKEILSIYEKKPYTEKACVIRAKNFNEREKFGGYCMLYKEVTGK